MVIAAHKGKPRTFALFCNSSDHETISLVGIMFVSSCVWNAHTVTAMSRSHYGPDRLSELIHATIEQ